MKMDNKAQGSQMLILFLVLIASTIIFGDPGRREAIAKTLDSFFFSTIGFSGEFVLFSIFLSGILVTLLSSFFTNLFTDWIAVGKSQEKTKAFQAEMRKAQREGNTAKMNKLQKHQQQLLKDQTEAQSGMTKPMIFLFLFIAPIFIWLTYFLGNLPYFYFTVPWAQGVSITGRAIGIMSNWFLLYMVFTMVFGQLIRAAFKYLKWTFQHKTAPTESA